jgi:SOS-response transcriptional repressor LexA
VAEEAGLGLSYLKDVAGGRSKSPGVQQMLQLATALEVDLEWLVTGRSARGEPDHNLVSVPELDLRVSAGGGAVVDEAAVKRRWSMPAAFMADLNVSPAWAVLVEVVGDSMAPRLMNGDLCLLDRRRKALSPSAIYALFDGDVTVCKRVELLPDRETLRIMSENPSYPSYTAPLEAVQIIGRVAWFGRRM